MREIEFTKILGWPGYRVYRHELDEDKKTLRLWVRRKGGNRKLICSGCGRPVADVHDSYEREVRDLPWRKYQTTVIVELYRVCCPQCGVRVERLPQLPSNAPFSKDLGANQESSTRADLRCPGLRTRSRTTEHTGERTADHPTPQAWRLLKKNHRQVE